MCARAGVELHEVLHKIKILARAPKLYPNLVNLNVGPSIVDLLNHDITDTAIDVVHLFQDLTDEDVLDDNDKPNRVLIEALVDNSALELLVQNLHLLTESDPDENAAVYNTLATIKNLIEVKPVVVELVCERTNLLKWLLGILAILLQRAPRIRRGWGR